MLDINNIEERIFSENNGNFQTMNMIHKIKKIKKRKKIENPKKIPFPEVLTNINKDSENENIINDSGKILKEGFDPTKFEYDDWEGYDNVKDKVGNLGGKDPRQVIIDFINKVYDSGVYYNKLLAKTITDKISTNQGAQKANQNIRKDISDLKKSIGGDEIIQKDERGNQNHDEEIVYKYVCLFEALIFSSFVVNNWYFLMFYNKGDDGDKFKLFDFSVDRIKSLSDDFLSNQFLKYIVLYFIEYGLFFPSALQYFLINMAPNFASKIFNHTLCYVILFFIIFNISYNFAWGLKQFLIDTINLNKKNFIVDLMYGTVFILFILSVVPKTYNSGNTDNSGNSSSSLLLILTGLWYMIRFMIIMAISVPLGGIFCSIYFVFYSLYAMLFYCNRDLTKVYDTFKDMLKYLDNKKVETVSEDAMTFFQLFMKKFNEYIEYISDNFFIMIYIITFIYALSDSQKNITNTTLKNAFYAIDLTVIFSLLGYLYYIIKTKFNVNSPAELIEKLKNPTAFEKNYDSSADAFHMATLGLYGVTVGGFGYFIAIMVKSFLNP